MYVMAQLTRVREFGLRPASEHLAGFLWSKPLGFGHTFPGNADRCLGPIGQRRQGGKHEGLIVGNRHLLRLNYAAVW